MQVLNYPFNNSVQISILNDAQINHLDCELAQTDVEIFQSLNFRKEKHFNKPMALLFINPLAKSFSKHSFEFPVEQIIVDYKNNIVKDIHTIYPNQNKKINPSIEGLTAYTNCALVILAPKGLSKSKNIQIAKTKISI